MLHIYYTKHPVRHPAKQSAKQAADARIPEAKMRNLHHVDNVFFNVKLIHFRAHQKHKKKKLKTTMPHCLPGCLTACLPY